MNLPVMTSQWVLSSWAAGKRLPEDAFRLRPFAGLEISVTGFEMDHRHDIERMIKENGGAFSGDLRRPNGSKGITHLICDTERLPKGPQSKYHNARLWKILTVTIEWLHESIKIGGKRLVIDVLRFIV